MGSVNGLSSGRRQAIVCTNAAILLILPLATNFTKLFSNFKYFYQRKCIWKCRPEKCRPFCRGPNVLRMQTYVSCVAVVPTQNVLDSCITFVHTIQWNNPTVQGQNRPIPNSNYMDKSRQLHTVFKAWFNACLLISFFTIPGFTYPYQLSQIKCKQQIQMILPVLVFDKASYIFDIGLIAGKIRLVLSDVVT